MAGGRLHGSLRGGGNGRQTARHTRTHTYIYTHTHTHIYIYTHTHTHTHTHRKTDRQTEEQKKESTQHVENAAEVVFGRKTASPEDRRKDAERDILRQFDENENRKTVAEALRSKGLHAGGILNEEAVLAATGEYTLEAVRDLVVRDQGIRGFEEGCAERLVGLGIALAVAQCHDVAVNFTTVAGTC